MVKGTANKSAMKEAAQAHAFPDGRNGKTATFLKQVLVSLCLCRNKPFNYCDYIR